MNGQIIRELIKYFRKTLVFGVLLVALWCQYIGFGAGFLTATGNDVFVIIPICLPFSLVTYPCGWFLGMEARKSGKFSGDPFFYLILFFTLPAYAAAAWLSLSVVVGVFTLHLLGALIFMVFIILLLAIAGAPLVGFCGISRFRLRKRLTADNQS